MTEEYAKHYRTLGIQPGAGWSELRKAYKNLLQIWHPDRFQQNPRQKKIAEEKTKEITQAYKELARYHKQFGVLPIDTEAAKEEPPHERTVPEGKPEKSVPDSPPGTRNPDITLTPENSSAAKRRDWRTRLTIRFAAALTLASAAWFAWHLVPWKHPDGAPAAEEHLEQSGEPPEDNSSDHGAAKKYFTVGSSLGEVYAIQGVPTRTEKDIWYYGSSRVYFVKGKVLKWEESPDNPLRIRIFPDIDRPSLYFERGSTKEEVLAIQGPPERDSGNVWDYGVSRVYFDKDRVKNWYESPLNPLKVRH